MPVYATGTVATTLEISETLKVNYIIGSVGVEDNEFCELGLQETEVTSSAVNVTYTGSIVDGNR